MKPILLALSAVFVGFRFVAAQEPLTVPQAFSQADQDARSAAQSDHRWTASFPNEKYPAGPQSDFLFYSFGLAYSDDGGKVEEALCDVDVAKIGSALVHAPGLPGGFQAVKKSHFISVWLSNGRGGRVPCKDGSRVCTEFHVRVCATRLTTTLPGYGYVFKHREECSKEDCLGWLADQREAGRIVASNLYPIDHFGYRHYGVQLLQIVPVSQQP